MPYFLGKTAPRTQNVPMAIAAIVPGLEQVAGEPSRANIKLIKHNYSITMDQLTTHPSESFAASFTGYPIMIGASLPLFNEETELFPISFPDLVVSFRNGIPSNHANSLKEIGYTEITIRGKQALLFSSPTIKDLKDISKTGPYVHTNTAVDTVNLHQMRDLAKISRIAMEAASFYHFKENIFNHAGSAGIITAGKNKTQVKIQAGGKDFSIYSMEVVGHILEPADLVTQGNTVKSIKKTALTDICIPALARIRMMKLSEMEKKTSAGGIFIPYVRRLSLPDYSLVPDFIKDFYYKKLGWTDDERSRNFNSLVGSWISIAQTSWGHQISHLFKCISLSKEGFCQLKPISNGLVYSGSILCGSFNISYHNKIETRLSQTALEEELDQINDHQQALDAILTLTEQNFPTSLGTFIKPTTIKTMRELHDAIIQVPFSPDEKTMILDYASKLSFNERPQPNGTSSLKNVFSYLVDRITPIPTNLYLDRKYLLSSDRAELVFAAFGTTAPTFTTPGGVKTSVSSTIAKISTQNRRKHGFTLRSVPVSVAVADFRQIESTKYVYNFAENRGKGIRERNLTGKEKEDIWNLLGDMVGVTQTDNPQAPTSSSTSYVTTNDPSYDQNLF